MGKINMDSYSNILKINDPWVMVLVGGGGGVVNGNVVNMYLSLKFKILIA